MQYAKYAKYASGDEKIFIYSDTHIIIYIYINILPLFRMFSIYVSIYNLVSFLPMFIIIFSGCHNSYILHMLKYCFLNMFGTKSRKNVVVVI